MSECVRVYVQVCEVIVMCVMDSFLWFVSGRGGGGREAGKDVANAFMGSVPFLC